MLEQVTANQTRFVAPGLSADARGVALGRFCVALLPSIDRVVGLFRGLSESGSLDDLLPSMKILQVMTPLKSREFIVRLPVTNSHVADGIAAVANLMGGLVFTGSSKHFVKFRDSRAPLGYDVGNLHAGHGDFILYASEFVQVYSEERALSFPRLALSLSLELEHNDELIEGERSLLRVVPGLWRMVTSYLHRNNLPCAVAACEGAPQASGRAERFYLVRCQIAPRMERLFRRTPGIEVHRLHTDKVAVQLGFRHPLELDSVSNIFKDGVFYLFSGERDTLDTISGDIQFVSARSLVRLGHESSPPRVQEMTKASVDGFTVPLKLVTASGSRPPVRASRIPVAQGPWLKKLVYLLPPQVLDSYSICCGAEHIYMLCEEQVDFIPLGTLFYQAALGVLVPVGFELLPRVHADVLVEHLGTGQDGLVFFVADSPTPLMLKRSDFAPLTRQALSRIEVQEVGGAPLPAERAPTTVKLVNDPMSAFPLWGFSADPPDTPDREG